MTASLPDGPIDPLMFGTEQPCFGCSPNHPIGFHLRFEREQGVVVTRFTPGESYQGPPGMMHGGLVGALADEVGAWTIIGLLGKFGFTAQMEAKLRRPIRIGQEVVGRGKIDEERGRTVRVSVELHQKGELAFTGGFTFVLMDKEGAERLLEGPIPDSWKIFAR
ncbi:MAG TPA: PaaI family thioesterase [Polyangiaceae bacterium]|jgi:acyl-coenzyme A thioesterase PaaI-like protein